MKRLLLALLLLLPSLAWAQKPPINSVAGPTKSAQLKSIITDPAGTGLLLFGASNVTTVNGVPCTIGASCSIVLPAFSLVPDITIIIGGTLNGLLYNKAPGVLGNLATANSGVLITSGAGAPSISTTLPNGLAMGMPTSLVLTNATGLPNAGLLNASTTVNGQTCTLGSTCTVTAAATNIAPGTTVVSPNTNPSGVFYNHAGKIDTLAATANGVLVTDGSGVPSIGSSLPISLWTSNLQNQTYYAEGTSVCLGATVGPTLAISIGSPAVLTWSSTPPTDGTPFFLTTSGSLPTGLSPNTVYYVKTPSGSTSNVSATAGGVAITTSGTQSGIHTGSPVLPKGGFVGNYVSQFSQLPWASGHGSYYNDCVGGSTTAQMVARYTTGNNTYGVTVPSAFSLAPIRNAGVSRGLYIIDATAINDNLMAIPSSTSIANLSSLSTTAMADGWFVIVVTSPVAGDTATFVNSMVAVAQAVRSGTIPSNLVMDAAEWLPNANSALYDDTYHFSLIGNTRMAQSISGCLTAAGCPTNWNGNFFNMPVTANKGIRVDNNSDTQPLAISSLLDAGVGAITLQNVNPNADTVILWTNDDVSVQYQMAISGSATGNPPFYIRDADAGVFRLRFETNGSTTLGAILNLGSATSSDVRLVSNNQILTVELADGSNTLRPVNVSLVNFGSIDSGHTRLIGNNTRTVFQLGDGSALSGVDALDISIANNLALVKTSVAMFDGAGVQLGTLGTAPTAGNPTKWLPINDNGTVRYVPSW